MKKINSPLRQLNIPIQPNVRTILMKQARKEGKTLNDIIVTILINAAGKALDQTRDEEEK